MLVMVQPPSHFCKQGSETRKRGGLGPDWSVVPHKKKNKNEFLISILCVSALRE
jgi:hypothetical protein